MFSDMNPRYAPDKVLTLENGLQPVVRASYYPVGQHPTGCPIVASMGVLALTASNGQIRYFGCDHAYINSELRMVVIGCDPRDEVRVKWAVVPDDRLI